ncbi:hypothetical protein MTYP_02603 [Methylophilaceae bacterium]|nr:hypothetical protein MTYP_02603 [Methylophilaceae bacterium]
MSSFRHLFLVLGMTGLFCFPAPAISQPASYGNSISLEQARLVASAAAGEARRQKLNVAIAIVDTGGHLVYYEKFDDTQTASAEVAVAKARSANNFRRSTKVFEDAVTGGRAAVLGLPGAVPIEGGLPILLNRRIIGAIGISGASSAEDGVIAAAGVDALEK